MTDWQERCQAERDLSLSLSLRARQALFFLLFSICQPVHLADLFSPELLFYCFVPVLPKIPIPLDSKFSVPYVHTLIRFRVVQKLLVFIFYFFYIYIYVSF
jgi:hypothetical protein